MTKYHTIGNNKNCLSELFFVQITHILDDIGKIFGSSIRDGSLI